MEPSDLGQLVTLDALLQESSVSGAARRLGLSTPAVSHALARLRNRFDDPLLVRAGRHMVLTPRADTLKPQVRDLISQAAQIFFTPDNMNIATLERSFTLCASDYVMLIIGEQLERRISEAAPKLALRFVPNTLNDIKELRSGDIELAIGIYGGLPPELKMKQLITDRFVCVVRNEHPEVKQRLTLEQYVQMHHVQIAPRGRPGGYVDDLLAERGYTRRVARALPFFTSALQMVAQTDYVLTVSERIAERMGPQLGLRILPPPLPLEPYALSMLWHPRHHHDPAHKWLREQLFLTAQSVIGTQHENPRKQLDQSDPTTGQGRKRPRKRNT